MGLGLDCWISAKMLLYYSWVNPNEGQFEPWGEASDVLLTIAVDDELGVVP